MDRNARRAVALPAPTQAWAVGAAVAAAVALPQVVHLVAGALGLGASLGSVWLPMHLPVLVVGFLAGPVAGVAAGVLSPLASFAVTGMPAVAILPVMVVELACYGAVAGLVRESRLPVVVQVLLVQLSGRALVVLLGLVPLAAEVAATATGLPGIVVQLVTIPLVLSAVRRRDERA